MRTQTIPFSYVTPLAPMSDAYKRQEIDKTVYHVLFSSYNYHSAHVRVAACVLTTIVHTSAFEWQLVYLH